MARDFAKSFYKSTLWEQCRDSFIAERRAIDGGMCQWCHNAPGYIVHHKVHLSASNINDQSISLSHNNLEYVCLTCHSEHHNSNNKHLLCSFDEKGRPIGSTRTEVSN